MSVSTTYTIRVVNGDEEFSCSADCSVLTSMEREQKNAIPVGCRGGGCGVCRIRILSGKFTARKMSMKHVTPEQAALGYALSCRVFPSSDMIIETDPVEPSK